MEMDFNISKDELLDFHMKYIDKTKVYNKQLRLFTINPLGDKNLFLDTIIKNTKLELKKQYPNDI